MWSFEHPGDNETTSVMLKALELLRMMGWPHPEKLDSGTFEVRRTYADETKFWDLLWDQCQSRDKVCDVTLILDDGSVSLCYNRYQCWMALSLLALF